jgi:hypothetical protein
MYRYSFKYELPFQVNYLLASRLWIRHYSSIRIRKVIESGSNADPDPQQAILL